MSGQKLEDLTGDGKTADDKGWTYGAATPDENFDGIGDGNLTIAGSTRD
jgi:hypothetical protein